MILTLKNLWRTSPKLLMAFTLAATLTVFFLGNIVFQAVYWANHRDMAVEPWMTVGYVGKSWGLQPHRIDEIAGLPQPKDHPLTLTEIALQRGIPVADVVAQVEAAVAQLQAQELVDGEKK